MASIDKEISNLLDDSRDIILRRMEQMMLDQKSNNDIVDVIFAIIKCQAKNEDVHV